MVFFAILGCDAYFKSELHRNYNLHMKFLAKNVDFIRLSFNLLVHGVFGMSPYFGLQLV